MTPEARKSLAEQLLANPLFNQIIDGLERDAIEALIMASTEQTRIEAQWRVNVARTFRENCERYARNTPPKKGAPA